MLVHCARKEAFKREWCAVSSDAPWWIRYRTRNLAFLT